jgi:hypothetical protein
MSSADPSSLPIPSSPPLSLYLGLPPRWLPLLGHLHFHRPCFPFLSDLPLRLRSGIDPSFRFLFPVGRLGGRDEGSGWCCLVWRGCWSGCSLLLLGGARKDHLTFPANHPLFVIISRLREVHLLPSPPLSFHLKHRAMTYWYVTPQTGH